jgi:hypothetical protein
MYKRNRLSILTSLSIFALALLSSGSSNVSAQKITPSGDLQLMSKSIPGVDVIVKKNPGGANSARSAKTTADGFIFSNLPSGTYQLTLKAPQVSQARMGKVEYLIVLQQFEPGSNPTAKTYTDSKSNTARVPIGKTEVGFEFAVEPAAQNAGINKSKSNIKNNRTGKPSTDGSASQGMDVRGKIFLVEIGTTKIVIDEAGVK